MTTVTIENKVSTVPSTVNIGDMVTSTLGDYIYGGEHEEAGFTSLTFDLRFGGTTLKASPELIAPANVPIDLKDPRITVAKVPDQRPVAWVGQWRAVADGIEYVSWEKTKRAGVLKMATMLAIKDWHAQGGIVNV